MTCTGPTYFCGWTSIACVRASHFISHPFDKNPSFGILVARGSKNKLALCGTRLCSLLVLLNGKKEKEQYSFTVLSSQSSSIFPCSGLTDCRLQLKCICTLQPKCLFSAIVSTYFSFPAHAFVFSFVIWLVPGPRHPSSTVSARLFLDWVSVHLCSFWYCFVKAEIVWLLIYIWKLFYFY